jgi:probable F420-dependent oxidoreductase
VEFWQAAAFADTTQLLDIARIAEEVGFDGISVSDHVFTPERLESPYPYTEDGNIFWTPEVHWPDPLAAISAMAAVTSKLRFATYIYVLPSRHPVAVAKTAATVAVLSGGRLVLGTGAGWMREEFDVLGHSFEDRGRRFGEMVEILRALWGGGMVTHHGAGYDFGPLQISPVPDRPVPILVGGHSDAAIRRAATVDGWMGMAYDLDEVEPLVRRVLDARKAAGGGEPFDVLLAVNAFPDYDTVRRLEEMGVTMLTASAWLVMPGDFSSLEAKRKAMEEFASSVIEPARR